MAKPGDGLRHTETALHDRDAANGEEYWEDFVAELAVDVERGEVISARFLPAGAPVRGDDGSTICGRAG